MKETLERIFSGRNLDAEEMKDAMEAIMEGEVCEVHMAAFLAGLRTKGETPVEIAAAASVMREKATPVKVNSPVVVDIVGTGGDRKGTFNISTAAAFVVAGARVPVAKHGNRAVSSLCGSADVLEALGVPFFVEPEAVSGCIDRTGFGFLFAPAFHKAMRHVAPVRKTLGLKTLFNILGPATNPARANYQVLGVSSLGLLRPMAEVMKALGVQGGMTVHGCGGIDEFSLEGPNRVCVIKDGEVIEEVVTPEDAGLARVPNEALAGGDAEKNRHLMLELLEGESGPLRDVVVLNSAAVFVSTGHARSFREGASMAAEVLDGGRAKACLEEVLAFAVPGEDGAA
ncbi:MAG: anthranilate phosphoribosyltransferase [Thermovirgaceae bacterium]